MSAIEQAFVAEKAWIAACNDPQDVLDRMAGYGESMRLAVQHGNALGRMRVSDLLEIAEDRVVELKRARFAAERRAQAPAPAAKVATPTPVERVAVRRNREEPAAKVRSEGPRGQDARKAEDERAREAANEDQAAATRMVNAQAAEIEARAALLRAQAQAAIRATVVVQPVAAAAPRQPAVTTTPKPNAPVPKVGQSSPTIRAMKEDIAPPPIPARPPARSAPASAPSVAADAKAQPAAPVGEFSEADKLALASVGCWPPTPVERRGAFWTRDADWPAEWTLTGGDLGRFRGDIHLTRAVFAAQLGVDSALLGDAELSPREKVGPALQIALRRAMDVIREQRRRERDERGARAAAAPTPAKDEAAGGSAAQPSASARALTMPAAAVAGAKPVAVFTGADMSRLRTERRLSQRELAALMGIGHGMVGKAELVPTKPLGEGMQVAFARVALPGGAPG